MTLTEKDYNNILDMIGDGKGYVEYEKDNEFFSFYYTLEVDGYCYDDYYNGTGEYVYTDVDFGTSDEHCDLITDEKCIDSECDCDFDYLYKLVKERYLG